MTLKYTHKDAARTYDAIEAALNGWWIDIAQDTYDIAQNEALGFVPYKTGRLQRSGYLDVKDITGFTIGYSAPYAGEVYGSPQATGPLLAKPYVMDCPPHFREGNFVRGHTKTFHTIGEKPSYIKKAGGWRTVNVNTTKALRKPNAWIQRACEIISGSFSPMVIKALGLEKEPPVQAQS